MSVLIKKFVGREEELNTLHELKHSAGADLVAVLGRRRVGKTFLIKEAFKGEFDFFFTGIRDSSKETLIKSFVKKIEEYSKVKFKDETPTEWITAFGLLKKYLGKNKTKRKKVVFLDEFPWMDTHLSGFLPAFEYFWNDWAVNQNIILVISGSSSSWMIENVRNNRGGLHNRISKYISLKPFTLAETEAFFKSRNINFAYTEIALIYMAMGGIPYYLQEVKRGSSAAQNLDRILFDPKSTIKAEFENLYRALFTYYDKYEDVVKALSTTKKGLTRNEIADKTKISNGGGLTKILTELEECNFILSFQPYGKTKRDTIYKLVDEYTLFYFQFRPDRNPSGTFISLQATPKVNTWKGLSFELLCLKHIDNLKQALGIHGIFSTQQSFYNKGSLRNKGFQIDLMIDRNDNVISICEMKYSQSEYAMSKVEAENLTYKREGFRRVSGTKKHLGIVLVTTHGLVHNKYSLGLIDHVVLLKDLF